MKEIFILIVFMAFFFSIGYAGAKMTKSNDEYE